MLQHNIYLYKSRKVVNLFAISFATTLKVLFLSNFKGRVVGQQDPHQSHDVIFLIPFDFSKRCQKQASALAGIGYEGLSVFA